MFKKIVSYEIKNQLKSPGIYLFGLVFFSIALVSMLGSGGYFDGPVTAVENVRILNSPYEINQLFQLFNKFFLFLLPAIIGSILYKDFESGIYKILYSYPIDKKRYLLGKLFSGLAIVIIISLSVVVAFLLAEKLLTTSNPMIDNTDLAGYFFTYLVYSLPNIILFGTVVFLIVGASRNIYAGYAAVILLFIIQLIVENIFVNSGYLIGLLDPFGQNAVAYETQFWTLEEKNNNYLPISGLVLQNRLLWTAIVAVVSSILIVLFRLQQDGFSLNLFASKGKRSLKENFKSSDKIYLSKVHFHHNNWHYLKSVWRLSIEEFNYILRSPTFIILVVFGISAVFFVLNKVTNSGNMTLWPVTRIMVLGPAFFFTLIVILITFLFMGMLVNRTYSSRMHLLTDVTATPDWVFIGSKILAITKTQICLLLILMATGVCIQWYNGYTDIDFGLYFFHLFAVILPSLIVWSFASLFIHSLISKLYLGLFVLMLGWMSIDQLQLIGIKTRLLKFNAPSHLTYSDLDGYGSAINSFVIVQFYWVIFGLLLVMLSSLLWRRGFVFTFKERLHEAYRKVDGKIGGLFIGISVLMTLLGFVIYKGEKEILFSQEQQNAALKEFEMGYEKYKFILPPKITSVKINMDIYPEQRSFKAVGEYTIINTSNKPIDTLLIKSGYDEETDYMLTKENLIISRDTAMEVSAHAFRNSLLPGDSLKLIFEVKNKENTLFERNSPVLGNGTFILHDAFPRLGYFINKEKKMPYDTAVNGFNYMSTDADLIHFETIVSTSVDQTALAPGYLLRKWKENGRNYFHYKMDKKIKLLYSFNSGVFEKAVENHRGVNLEIHHHPKHHRNNAAVMDGLKAALDYNIQHFSPYQHSEARVVEFAESEGTFATTCGNLIPMSERRFIIKAGKKEDKIDLPFYVPAHELTHQWWGNQLIPADAYGAKMLTESITEYVTLNIYREFFGEQKAHQFLEFQRDYYLRGRARDVKKEQPLYLVEESQTHISYGKGALVFNALSHYLGQNRLNEILKEFLLTFQYRTDRYPTSIDLVEKLKKEVPEELNYLIDDMFTEIVLYELAISDMEITESNDKYRVSATLKVNKDYINKKDIPHELEDFIELGFYNEKEELLSLERVLITDTISQHIFDLDVRPVKIILDPNLLVMERNRNDNKVEM